MYNDNFNEDVLLDDATKEKNEFFRSQSIYKLSENNKGAVSRDKLLGIVLDRKHKKTLSNDRNISGYLNYTSNNTYSSKTLIERN